LIAVSRAGFFRVEIVLLLSQRENCAHDALYVFQRVPAQAINASEREGTAVYRVIVYPTGYIGREAPYRDFIGEEGYEMARKRAVFPC
jgi:hypothetical protein